MVITACKVKIAMSPNILDMVGTIKMAVPDTEMITATNVSGKLCTVYGLGFGAQNCARLIARKDDRSSMHHQFLTFLQN